MIGNTVLFALITNNNFEESKTSEVDGLVIDSWTDTHTDLEGKTKSIRKYKILFNVIEDYQHFVIIDEWQIIRILKLAK